MNQSPANHNESPISIRDIQVFRHNPRKSPNPLYHEIKDSIKSDGLSTPLHVVFHPDEQCWVLSRGGQTRLSILTELYNETNDSDFLHPSVVVEPYVSDCKLVVQHVVENKLRSPNSYFEIAKSLSLVRQMLTQENGGKSPTQEDLSRYMSRSGFPVRRQSLSGYFYLSDTLLPQLSDTTLLSSVVSQSMMDQIRSLRHSLTDVLDGNSFDAALIHFINSRNSTFSFSDIKTYISSVTTRPRTEKVPKTNGYFAKSLLSNLGFDPSDVIPHDNPIGFLVCFPSEVQDSSHADALYFLASLSGLLEESASPELLSKINLDFPGVHQGTSLSELINRRCRLSQSDLPSLTSRMLRQTNDDAFNHILELFKSMRSDQLESSSTK